MLGRFVTGWLNLETKTSCPDFDLSARAGVLALEREFHPSSISCAVLDARAWDWTLEREVVSDARARSWALEQGPDCKNFWECAFAARAGVCEWRSSGGFHARAGRLVYKSETRLSGSVFIFFFILKP